eukprot:11225400-Lingulodinium_polyedra.AAC.1
MVEQGVTDVTSLAAVGVCGVKCGWDKVSRAQFGSGLHEMWMKDLFHACGAGESLFAILYARCIMKAAIAAKVFTRGHQH